MQKISSRFWGLILAAAVMGLFAGGAQAQPQEVVVGSYINKIQDLDFPGNKYAIDFYLWFRWKAEGSLADYNPMDSFEIMNGTIDIREAQDIRKIGDVMYAQARVAATMNENWQMEKFPFDAHSMTVNIEDSSLTTQDLVFVTDQNNSKLGDEINMPGWDAADFRTEIMTKVYQSNYGDISQPSDARSDYSRYMISMSIHRQGYGSALKLLSTVLLATAVAFLAFVVKPSDLDARFGMGVGSLFAVAASAFIAAASVPDSGVMTIADNVHMVAFAFIFTSLLVSTVGLKLEVNGREKLAYRIDRYCLVIFPVGYFGWAAWEVWKAMT
jgi:hypothetical protein